MVITSEHSKTRIKDRCGIPKKAADKITQEAFENGITHSETSGSLNRYITSLYFYNNTANNIRIYHQKVFIFAGEILITVLNLPQKYKKTAEKIIKGRASSLPC